MAVNKTNTVVKMAIATLIPLMANPSVAVERPKPWQSIDMSESPVTVQIPGGEKDGVQIGVSQNGSPSLTKTYERLEDDPDYIALKAKTDAQDEKIDEMLDRLDALRDKNRHWEAAPELTNMSGWATVGAGIPTGPWSPAIDKQESDFIQERPIEFKQERTYTYYDKIAYEIGYGEDTRVSYTRTEEQRVPDKEVRLINVQMSPYTNVGGKYSCGGYTPATSTVEEGKSFQQTGVCKQNQERTISYLTSGELLAQRTASQTIDVSDSKWSVGTGEICRYNTSSYVQVTTKRFDQRDHNNTGSEITARYYWNGTHLGTLKDGGRKVTGQIEDVSPLRSGVYTYRIGAHGDRAGYVICRSR